MKLESFLTELDRHEKAVPIDELVDRLERLEITRADVEHIVAFDDDRYKRNVLRVGSGYAALILCWQPGQSSPIHDHRGSACGVLVLDGLLHETKYKRGADGMLRATTTGTMRRGDVCGSYDADIHVIGNRQPPGQDLVTLHVYTPPLRDFHIYSLDSPEVEVCQDRETMEAQRQLEAQRA